MRRAQDASLTVLGWACRRVLREPGTALLTGLAIFALVVASATPLLLVEASRATSARLLAGGPTHVVRRLDALAWQPLPASSAVEAAQRVVGVTTATARIFGLARGPHGTVTVRGVDAALAARLRSLGLAAPAPGEALIGRGVLEKDDATMLRLDGPGATRALHVVGRLGAEYSLVVHDVALVHVDDARAVLGLGPDAASDLAISVFHAEEEQAIVPELAAAFPWPVRITTRREAIGTAAAALSREGALRTVLLVPALLALALLVLATLRRGRAERRELGLYKALGWTTGDLARLQLLQATAIALPSVLFGLAVAWGVVFWPGLRWAAEWLLAWPSTAPPLTLAPGGALVVLLGIGGAVLVPWLVAALAPALRSAAVDPQEMLRGGSS